MTESSPGRGAAASPIRAAKADAAFEWIARAINARDPQFAYLDLNDRTYYHLNTHRSLTRAEVNKAVDDLVNDGRLTIEQASGIRLRLADGVRP